MNIVLNILGAVVIIYMAGIIALLTVFRKYGLAMTKATLKRSNDDGDKPPRLGLEALESKIGTKNFMTFISIFLAFAWLPILIMTIKEVICDKIRK